MPTVICGACQHEASVRFMRGTCLADVGCPACGENKLHLPRRPGTKTTAGRTYEHCVACGRRGLSHLHKPYEWEPKYALPGQGKGPYPAGAPSCWSHEPVPAARTRYENVIADLQERLGPVQAQWPADAITQALHEIARPAPGRCPVCAAAGRRTDPARWPEEGDFALQPQQLERGAALLGHCWDCGHVIEVAAMRPGGPYIMTLTEPGQGTLRDPPHWVVTTRRPSSATGAAEVDTYWAGPLHGHDGPAGHTPGTWHDGPPGDQVMRFPSPGAAQAALDSVFAPGSRWQLSHTSQIRIILLPQPPARGVRGAEAPRLNGGHATPWTNQIGMLR